MRMIPRVQTEYDRNGPLGYIGEIAQAVHLYRVCMGGPETWFELAEL